MVRRIALALVVATLLGATPNLALAAPARTAERPAHTLGISSRFSLWIDRLLALVGLDGAGGGTQQPQTDRSVIQDPDG